MSTPAERFEVPPEYAEVYERAYRRAYEEGQGRLAGLQAEQRSSSARVPAQRSTSKPAHVDPPVVTKPPTRNAGHRGAVRNASRLSLVLAVICLALLLVLGAVVRLVLG